MKYFCSLSGHLERIDESLYVTSIEHILYKELTIEQHIPACEHHRPYMGMNEVLGHICAHIG